MPTGAQELKATSTSSAIEELTKDNFENLFGDSPLTITDSEVKD